MNDKNEKMYWFAFSLIDGLGPKRFALLKNYFGSVQKAWQASFEDLIRLGLDKKTTEKFLKFKKNINLSSSFLRLREKRIECQILADDTYPENLKKIDNPPFVLFVKGKIKASDKKALAVVGSRRMSCYGLKVTQKLVNDLVKEKITIVSGLARGIDTMVHQTALKAGGRTIAVLGSGLENIYPPENKSLAEEIIKGHGAVVSEFPPEQPPAPANFPARNRIIAGLSLGTLVIEGAAKSGSLITARWAAEQGKEVFAVPGPIDVVGSQAPLFLIKQGAKVVETVEDILEELNFS
ncbi:DNA-processing protein DprA [Patescibacteria group bacterium]|nr:DNA-processing protein DprA [Patescibacteria group bacterium]